jgi:hypothetical protein
MGKEVRKVPSYWQHPKNSNGKYIPLFRNSLYLKHVHDWEFNKEKWDNGLVFDPMFKSWVCKTSKEEQFTFEEYYTVRPSLKNYMPAWKLEERTHYMLYENVTEGTPISPIFPSIEKLAQWLFDNHIAYVFGKVTSYEEWISILTKEVQIIV